jgi:hypothetical protein
MAKRKVEFHVPSAVMAEFAQELSNRDFVSVITGTTDDDEIVIEIEYDQADSDEIDEIEEKLDSLCEELEEENK